MIRIPLIILTFFALFFFNQNDNTISNGDDPNKDKADYSFKVMDFLSLRDTLYTFEPYFIEVNLASQKGYLFSREGLIKEFGVSSGNKKLFEAVDTNEGLFVIQSKLLKWHSRQFDSTLMLNWMGFNHGIGFHALLGNSYYKYLGVKKTSHGCLRISREDAKEIYKLIDFGTPVLVHSGNNAVYIGFGDTTKYYENYSYNELRNLLPNRYSRIYDGHYFLEEMPKIIIGMNNINHTGLPIGEKEKIPKRQVIKPLSLYVQSAIPDKIKIMEIKKHLIDTLLSMKIK